MAVNIVRPYAPQVTMELVLADYERKSKTIMIIVHNHDYGDYQENVGTYKFDIAMLSFIVFGALDSPDKAYKDVLLNAKFASGSIFHI